MTSILPTLTLSPQNGSILDTVLDSFVFEGFEEPYELIFGKEQSAYKHILIGGGRIIDLMGAGDPDLTWSGYFTGIQASLRARYLETLCNQAQPLTLTTNAFSKSVVITKFTYGQHEKWPIKYTITCQVIQDNTLPVNVQVPGDLTITTLEYLFQAENIAALINDGGVNAAIGLAIQAAQAAAPFDGANNAAISAALSAAQNAVAIVGTAIGTTETSILDNEMAVNPDQLISKSDDLQKLDKLYTLQNILNAYVVKNLLLVGQSDQSLVVTFIDPNLYRIAVQYYGNVNYWTVIANANNLVDPYYTGTISLLIPPKPSVESGGLLNPTISTRQA